MSDCMIREDCILVTHDTTVLVDENGASTTRDIAHGTYLDPKSDKGVLSQIPDDFKVRCSWLRRSSPPSIIFIFSFYMLLYTRAHGHCHTCSRTHAHTQENQCSIAPILSVIFFCTYMLLCAYLLLQLVIAIVLENIQAQYEQEELVIRQDHITKFVGEWGRGAVCVGGAACVVFIIVGGGVSACIIGGRGEGEQFPVRPCTHAITSPLTHTLIHSLTHSLTHTLQRYGSSWTCWARATSACTTSRCCCQRCLRHWASRGWTAGPPACRRWSCR